MQSVIKRITFLGILASIGIIIGYIESFIVLPVRVPGIKIGLSNIITIIALYLLGPFEALMVLITRVILTGLLFGNGMSILYSFAGAIMSFGIMLSVYRCNNISIIGTSVLGGVTHNLGQIIVAAIVVWSNKVFYYIPVLILFGVGAGIITGSVALIIYNRVIKLSFSI